MRRRQRSFAELLTRALAASGLVYALVAAYLVSATLFVSPATQSQGGPDQANPSPAHPLWKPAYGARFHGCVDIEAWTMSAVPSSVVVVRRTGEVARMRFDEAFERSRSESHADDVWTVGACE